MWKVKAIVWTFYRDGRGEREDEPAFFGPFLYRDGAERCVIALAGNPNIVGAAIVYCEKAPKDTQE